jgi:hypothetical protein
MPVTIKLQYLSTNPFVAVIMIGKGWRGPCLEGSQDLLVEKLKQRQAGIKYSYLNVILFQTQIRKFWTIISVLSD